MNRIVAVTAPALFLLSAIALSGIRPHTIPSPLSPDRLRQGRGPGNPGFQAQWEAMRRDPETGQILPFDYNQLHRQEQTRKTHASFITNWIELGPSDVGGRTRSMFVSSSNPQIIYAAGVSGGVWRSADGGGTWQALSDFEASLSITSLAEKPGSPATIYAGTGEPRGNSSGLAAAGILKSTDYGSTWSLLPDTDTLGAIWKVFTSPRAGQENWLYVATAGNGMARSQDGGQTFQWVLLPGAAHVTDIEVFPSGRVMAAVRDKGIYVSASGDAGSFSRLTNGLPASAFRRIDIAWAPSDTNRVYAAIEDSLSSTYSSGLKGVWKSTNGGSTWAAVTNPEAMGGSYPFPWYALQLGIKPDDPDYVVCGCVDMMFSTDAGQSWVSAAYAHADNHIALFHPQNPNQMLVGNDGGIHEYDAPSADVNATSLNHFYNVTQFYTGAYFPTGQDVIGGTQDNGTHALRGLVTTSDKWFGGDGSFCAIHQQNPQVAYVSYQYGHIYRCDDAAQSNPIFYDVLANLDANLDGDADDPTWFINPFVMNPLDGDQIFYTTHYKIYRTTDGAQTWTPLTQNLFAATDKMYITGLSASTNPTVYIGGEKAMFLRVDNAAAAPQGTEVDLSASVPAAVTNHFINCLRVNPADAGEVYVAFSTTSTEPRLWKVTQALTGSPVWTSIQGDLSAGLPVNWIELGPDAQHLICGTDYGLYVSSNGGMNWEKESVLPNVPVFQVHRRPSDGAVFAFTHGRGAYTGSTQVIAGRTLAAGGQYSLWPTRVRDAVQVANPGSLPADWELVNAAGQVLANGALPPGTTQVRADALATGMYYLRIRGSAGVETLRFLRAD